MLKKAVKRAGWALHSSAALAGLPWQPCRAVVLCQRSPCCARSRAWRPSPAARAAQVRGCVQWDAGQRRLSRAPACFAVSVWFFHLGDNSYPMRDLCSVYFTTPCDNQNPALNFFTTKETRTLPRRLFTGWLAARRPFSHTQKAPKPVEIKVTLVAECSLVFHRCGWRSGALTWPEIPGVNLLWEKREGARPVGGSEPANTRTASNVPRAAQSATCDGQGLKH